MTFIHTINILRENVYFGKAHCTTSSYKYISIPPVIRENPPVYINELGYLLNSYKFFFQEYCLFCKVGGKNKRNKNTYLTNRTPFKF